MELELETERVVFPNAPITEAVIDFRVQLPEDFETTTLNFYSDFLEDRYPDKIIQRFIKGGIKITGSDEKQMDTTSGVKGLQFVSKKEKKAVQVQVDGFTFSKLKPYERWENFIADGRTFWNHYTTLTRPKSILRMSLRYINRIEVPFPFNNFNEYILTNPQIAPNLPQAVSNFFMRLEIPSPDIDALAIITQTIDSKYSDFSKVPLILDIDVIHSRELKPNDEKIWSIFEELHVFKNEIFFNSITEKARGLFS